MMEDYFILINQGMLYEVVYNVPQSLDQQNISTRDFMIRSLAVGDSYDNHQQVIAADILADLRFAQNVANGINCIGWTTPSFTAGDGNLEIYNANCE
jgi:hypothetical protein